MSEPVAASSVRPNPSWDIREAQALLSRRRALPPSLRPIEYRAELATGTLIVSEAQLQDLELMVCSYPDSFSDFDPAAYLAACAEGRVLTRGES
jgi:hypothetical protein